MDFYPPKLDDAAKRKSESSPSDSTPPSAGERSITITSDQMQAGVGAYHGWKANMGNHGSSAYGGNLHDLARRIFVAMSNAAPQERSAEASSRADGEASAAKKPGATASTPCLSGEAEASCGAAPITQSATLSINELAERCWPAVRSWLNQAERMAMHPPKPEYKAILEADADRARKLLDDIEALVGRPVEPHRSGGPRGELK